MAQEMMKRMPSGLEEGLERMSPTEVLAVEHGLLTRILLAMNNVLSSGGSVPKTNLGPINQGCRLIRQAVVDHHMKIEEESIYPKFDGTELADCANTIKMQHDEGRRLLSCMESLAKAGTVRSPAHMDDLKKCFNDFKNMITAHAAFEETVIFPYIEGNWSQDDLDDLRENEAQDLEKLMGDDATRQLYHTLTSLESACGITGLRDYNVKLK